MLTTPGNHVCVYGRLYAPLKGPPSNVSTKSQTFILGIFLWLKLCLEVVAVYPMKH